MLLKSQSKKRFLTPFAPRPRKRFMTTLGMCGGLFIAFGILLSHHAQIRQDMQDVFVEASTTILHIMEAPLTFFKDVKTSLHNHQLLQHHTTLLSDITEKNEHLMKQNQALSFRVKDLESILSLKTTSQGNTVTVPCFGQQSSTRTGALYIHADSQTGLSKNLPVMGRGSLIGLVDHIGTQTSRVILLNHDRCRLPIVSHDTNQEGILASESTGQLTIQFSRDPSLYQIGEAIYTSGTDGILPRGLLIGHVKMISDTNVYIQPATNPKDLRYVHVFLPQNTQHTSAP